MLSVAFLCAMAHVVFSAQHKNSHFLHTHQQLSPSEVLSQWNCSKGLEKELILEIIFMRAEEFLPVLSQKIRHGTEREKMAACGILGQIRHWKDADALLHALMDPSPRVQVRVIDTLRVLKIDAAVPDILEKLRQADNTTVLKSGLVAIGELGSPKHLSVISSFLNHPNRGVRVHAAAALAGMGYMDGESELLEATKNARPVENKVATYALGFLKTPTAKARLEEILEDPNGKWKSYAKIAQTNQAIEQMNFLEQVAHLEELVFDTNRRLSHWAVEQLSLRKGVSPVLMRRQIRDMCNAQSRSELKHETPVHAGMSRDALDSWASPFYNPDAQNDVIDGSIEEDESHAGENCAFSITASFQHAYNPITGEGWHFISGIYDSALVHSIEMWDGAVSEYQGGNYLGCDAAYFYLGRTLHLLQDMSAPAHTHSDIHIDGDDFETWGLDHYPFDSVILSSMDPKFPQDGRGIDEFIHEMALFSYDLSAFYGILVESEDPQPDCELARMFPSLHFHDGGLLGDDYWEIDNIGRFEATFGEEWWACEEDFIEDHNGPGGSRRILGNFYIENSGGDDGNLTPDVFEKPLLHTTWTPGKTILQLYGDELYPECIRYCAGLLNVYFLQVQPVGSGDLNLDLTVDLDDLLILADYLSFNRTDIPAGDAKADCNNDGQVDAADMDILLLHLNSVIEFLPFI